jgi:hypothetical protein
MMRLVAGSVVSLGLTVACRAADLSITTTSKAGLTWNYDWAGAYVGAELGDAAGSLGWSALPEGTTAPALTGSRRSQATCRGSDSLHPLQFLPNAINDLDGARGADTGVGGAELVRNTFPPRSPPEASLGKDTRNSPNPLESVTAKLTLPICRQRRLPSPERRAMIITFMT